MFFSNKKGFTLVEIVATVSIMLILAAISVLSLDMIKKEQLKNREKGLFSDLQATRADAMMGTTQIAKGLRLESHSYVIFSFDDKTGNYIYDNATEESKASEKNIFPIQIKIRTTDGGPLAAPVSPNNVIIFDRFGFPRQSDWNMVSDKFTIVMSSPALAKYTRCILIETTRIREGTWDDATSTCTVQ